MVKEFDFYNGFEGEPEIIISRKDINGDIKMIIRLWIGFFDSIMNLIKPDKNGKWEGVPLYYHEETAWYDGSPWKCDHVELLIIQLESVDTSELDIKRKKILEILMNELKRSVSLKEYIYIEIE